MSSTSGTPESQLATLKAKALKAYSQKDYATSTELYASACELQSSLYGENNPKNAHLLYLYGRSLFEVAVRKSDVLGGVKDDKEENKEKKGKGKGKEGAKDKLELSASTSKVVVGQKAPEKGVKGGFFQFTGDENWDDTDEEDEDKDDEEDKAQDDDDDDFTLAWEILDYARVLFVKQLFAETETTDANPPTTTDSTRPIATIPNEDTADTTSVSKSSDDGVRALRTALADTFDLLGEVSLESESFAQAAKDLRSSLDLKLNLYPQESTLISEAHFKLSLALEFTAAGEDVSDSDRAKGREDAAIEMEKAIASCRARIAKEEAESAAGGDDKGKGKEVVTKSLQDAKEMVEELEIRLADLRTTGPSPAEDAANKLQGILGQVLGEDQAVARRRIEEAMSGARDLSGLVRKKAKQEVKEEVREVREEAKEEAKGEAKGEAKESDVPVIERVLIAGGSNGGKRKLDDLVEEEEGGEKSEVESKKTKVEEVEVDEK